MDMFNRVINSIDNDDIYLDTLREQATILGIQLNNGVSAPGSEE